MHSNKTYCWIYFWSSPYSLICLSKKATVAAWERQEAAGADWMWKKLFFMGAFLLYGKLVRFSCMKYFNSCQYLTFQMGGVTIIFWNLKEPGTCMEIAPIYTEQVFYRDRFIIQML